MTSIQEPKPRFQVWRTIVDYEVIYNWLADNRQTVSGFCRGLGITRQTFYQWGKEEGASSPSLAMRKRLIGTMGLPYNVLFTDIVGQPQKGRV